MRVRLNLLLDCPPDAAWEAVHSPAVFQAVSGPITAAQSLEPGGFPQRWADTEHRVRLRMLGLLPMGTQLIALRDETRADGTRIVHDEGGPLTGAMSIVSRWHHRMAISPDPAAPDSRTRFRDALDVGAGVLTPVVWFGFWVFWQLRAQQLRRLAPGWAVQFGPAASAGGRS
ncbi:MAG: hypothetical protein KJ659_03405 [Actinobacteria bacterium]|nr:hypothetical protein [Actinomycetota bacterium]MBU1609438.1 hypothetical protein [Actinomycetota bacterium]MBU2315204.1 hypothetical protein [Actinomycetota bacterium]MBU2384534.1 hypothetical protein [Actinomycetota bacterium]